MANYVYTTPAYVPGPNDLHSAMCVLEYTGNLAIAAAMDRAPADMDEQDVRQMAADVGMHYIDEIEGDLVDSMDGDEQAGVALAHLVCLGLAYAAILAAIPIARHLDDVV